MLTDVMISYAERMDLHVCVCVCVVCDKIVTYYSIVLGFSNPNNRLGCVYLPIQFNGKS